MTTTEILLIFITSFMFVLTFVGLWYLRIIAGSLNGMRNQQFFETISGGLDVNGHGLSNAIRSVTTAIRDVIAVTQDRLSVTNGHLLTNSIIGKGIESELKEIKVGIAGIVTCLRIYMETDNKNSLEIIKALKRDDWVSELSNLNENLDAIKCILAAMSNDEYPAEVSESLTVIGAALEEHTRLTREGLRLQNYLSQIAAQRYGWDRVGRTSAQVIGRPKVVLEPPKPEPKKESPKKKAPRFRGGCEVEDGWEDEEDDE